LISSGAASAVAQRSSGTMAAAKDTTFLAIGFIAEVYKRLRVCL
jgi:hypothetical protein